MREDQNDLDQLYINITNDRSFPYNCIIDDRSKLDSSNVNEKDQLQISIQNDRNLFCSSDLYQFFIMKVRIQCFLSIDKENQNDENVDEHSITIQDQGKHDSILTSSTVNQSPETINSGNSGDTSCQDKWETKRRRKESAGIRKNFLQLFQSILYEEPSMSNYVPSKSCKQKKILPLDQSHDQQIVGSFILYPSKISLDKMFNESSQQLKSHLMFIFKNPKHQIQIRKGKKCQSQKSKLAAIAQAIRILKKIMIKSTLPSQQPQSNPTRIQTLIR